MITLEQFEIISKRIFKNPEVVEAVRSIYFDKKGLRETSRKTGISNLERQTRKLKQEIEYIRSIGFVE